MCGLQSAVVIFCLSYVMMRIILQTWAGGDPLQDTGWLDLTHIGCTNTADTTTEVGAGTCGR